MSVQNKWDQFVANTNVGLFYLLMKTLKFLVAIWCTKAVHWLFSELCGYGACFCAASVLHYRSACCQCISWSMHTCLGPPPDVLNWVTREASGGDDTIFHVKLLKRCTKTNNCRRALFVFPFEVLPCHSRLDDPAALDHEQWEDVDEEEGIHVCVYILRTPNKPKFHFIDLWMVRKMLYCSSMFTVLFDIYTPERSNISRVEFGFYANCSCFFFL